MYIQYDFKHLLLNVFIEIFKNFFLLWETRGLVSYHVFPLVNSRRILEGILIAYNLKNIDFVFVSYIFF